MTAPVRWGILGTAHIATRLFLPGLRAAAGGTAAAVASRDGARAQLWAADNGVERGIAGYEALLADPDIDAVYVPLPNALHAEWTIAALEAGKPVLCEKPLCLDEAECRRVLDTAARTGTPLWEAFVFPYGAQWQWLTERIESGAIGELSAVVSEFHFELRNPANIRMDAALGGGAIYDIGCYPVRLGQLLLGGDPVRALVSASFSEGGVDIDSAGIVEFSNGRRLEMSCGFTRNTGTFSRIIGTDGEIRVENPFHPLGGSLAELCRDGESAEQWRAPDRISFSYHIAHIHDVIRNGAKPEHSAADDSLATARVLDLLRAAATA